MLIEKPASDKKDELLKLYERDLEAGEQVSTPYSIQFHLHQLMYM